MKKKKVYVLLILISTVVLLDKGGLSAQHKKECKWEKMMPAQERVEIRVRRLTDVLGLTEDQTEKVRKILIKGLGDIEEVKKEVREKARAIKDKTDTEILGVLDGQQRTKFKDMMEARQKKAEKIRQQIKRLSDELKKLEEEE